MSEPRMAAGRALLDSLWEMEQAEYGSAAPESDRELFSADILKVEAEAAELADVELRDEVARLKRQLQKCEEGPWG